MSLRTSVKQSRTNAFPCKGIDPSPVILCADSVVINAETELRGGQVRVSGGKITHVASDLTSRFPDDEPRQYPGCVLMPGLVNAHTHIEMTLLRGLGRGLVFPGWIAAITKEIMSRDESFFRESAIAGVEECLSGGVTSVADHSTFGVAPAAIDACAMRAIVYKEVFCPDNDADYEPQFDQLAAWLAGRSQESVRRGWSMHAPYNAAPKPLGIAVDRFKGYPRSIHVSESLDECAYIRDGQGLFANGHRARGLAVQPRNASPVQYLDQHHYWEQGTLAIHLTRASDDDFVLLNSRSASAVFCPISNAALGVGVPRIAEARRSGLHSALGTDSALSNERLDMFEEMRCAVLTSRAIGDPITVSEVFAMATSEGARAVGLADVGQLRVGYWADIAVVRLDRPSLEGSIVDQIVWQASSECTAATWVAGKQVYGVA